MIPNEHDGRRQKPLVLVLDDEDCVRTTIEIMLRRSGYEPVTARTGREALEVVQTVRDDGRFVDVAIVDLSLHGGESGEDVLLRLSQARPSLRAIATSGDVEHPVMVSPESAGFVASLAKPFRIAEMSSTIASVLREQASLRHR